MEGSLRTSFQKKAFGVIGGTEFFGEVETDLGKGKVKFIVEPRDVPEKHTRWTGHASAEDMLSDVSTPAGSHQPIYN